MSSIIEIRGLGKKYKLAEAQRYLALRDVISNAGKQLFSKGEKEKEFWALKDINFDIQPGERVGIIGRNGAGKSTLLKILSKITPPTTGEIKLHGRVASLLEVGTGFHPELTGRENIFLNGAILGLNKKEIQKKLDEIIDFSGVEKFIDSPLKHYSSGMQLRLAFSVAAHLEPEILLIDEVLAVGDMEFQKKCLGKMEEVSKKEGRTILFVSHDLSAISTLTTSCVFLDQGQIKSSGSTHETISDYTRAQPDSNVHFAEVMPGIPTITKVEMVTSEGGTLQSHGATLSINFEIDMPSENYTNMAISFQVFNELNQPVLFNWLFDIDQPFCRQKGKNYLTFTYPAVKLYKGNYYLRIHLAESKTKRLFQQMDCCSFIVEMINQKEPEWGWQNKVCQFIDEGNWISGK
jgi:lipopolysaccharide transport system ATP-binding protein